MGALIHILASTGEGRVVGLKTKQNAHWNPDSLSTSDHKGGKHAFNFCHWQGGSRVSGRASWIQRHNTDQPDEL